MKADPAQEVIERLTGAGFRLTLAGEDSIKVKPASNLTETLRATIKEYKPALVAYLKCNTFNGLGEIASELFQERSAIMEFDGGLQRTEAERLALLQVNYLLHHWGCKTCSAAGQAGGERCDTGMRLWEEYEPHLRHLGDAGQGKAQSTIKPEGV